MSIKIAPDSKSLRIYRIAYGVGGLTLITIFGPSALGYESLITLSLFLEGISPIFFGIGFGLLLFKSIFIFNIPEILIDESEIHAIHDYWSQSFIWNKFKKVCLYKNRIELTYRQSGQTESFKLPFLLRSRTTEICNLLEDMCSQHEIDFEVQHPYQPTSNSYGLQNNH